MNLNYGGKKIICSNGIVEHAQNICIKIECTNQFLTKLIVLLNGRVSLFCQL